MIIKALKDPKNWRPNLTRISKEILIPISTVHDIYNRLLKEEAVHMNIPVENFVRIKRVEDYNKKLYKELRS